MFPSFNFATQNASRPAGIANPPGLQFAVAGKQTSSPRISIGGGVLTVYLGFIAMCVLVCQSFNDLGTSTFPTLGVALQCLAYLCMSVRISQEQSVGGISAQMLIMLSMSHGLRLCTTTYLNGYIPVDATGDWLFQALDVFALVMILKLLLYSFGVYRQTLWEETRWFGAVPLALLCSVLAGLVHPDLNSRPIFDTIWAASWYIGSVAVVPQLAMVLGTKRSKYGALTRHFIVPGLASAGISIAFWIQGYPELAPLGAGDNHWNITGWAVLGAAILQTVLFSILFLLYCFRVGARLSCSELLPQLKGSCSHCCGPELHRVRAAEVPLTRSDVTPGCMRSWIDSLVPAIYCGVIALGALVCLTFTELGMSTLPTVHVALQCLGTVCLRVRIAQLQTVAGVSARMVAMQAASHALRLSGTTWLQGYIPVDGTGDGLYQLFDIIGLLICLQIIFRDFRTYGETVKEVAPVGSIWHSYVFGCFVLAVIVHPDLDARPAFDTLWATSLYVGALQMAPQLLMVLRDGSVEMTGSFATAAAIGYCANFSFWWHGYPELAPLNGSHNYAGWAVLAALAVQGLLIGALLTWHVIRACRRHTQKGLLTTEQEVANLDVI